MAHSMLQKLKNQWAAETRDEEKFAAHLAAYGSTPPRGSPSAKVSRSRSLPTKVFSRRLSHDYGWSIRGQPLLENVDGIDPAIEYERLVELEKLHGKENTGFCGATKQDIIRSCISSPRRGSREEIIYEEEEEEEDDFVRTGNVQQIVVGSVKASPAFSRVTERSRLSSQSAPCLDEYLGEAEVCEAVDVVPEDVVVDPVVGADGLSVGEDSGKLVFEVTEDKSAKPQEDSLDLPENRDRNYSYPLCVTEFVGQSLSLESLSVDSASNSNSELPCNGNGSDVCEGDLLLEGNSCTTGGGSRDEVTGSGCFDTAESCRKATSDIVLRDSSYHALQVQEYVKKPRTWKRLNRTACDKRNSGSDHRGREGERNMTGKGKLNLTFNSSLKRQPGSRRNSFADNKDCDWDSSPGKRMKDGVGGGDATPSDLQPDAFAWGWMSQTDAFLGYDAAGFPGKGPAGGQHLSGGYVRRSPKKTSRGTALARNVRGLRASPKPVSSLESCLRAQVVDPPISNRAKAVSRPLNFTSSVAGESKVKDASIINTSTGSPISVDKAAGGNSSKRRQSTLPKLPNLSKFLKEYAAKLAISSKAESSTDGGTSLTSVQVNNPASSSADDGNYSERPSFESLLFSFGVGLGVLFGSGSQKLEAQRLRQLLEETQANLETLKLELARRKSPARTNVYDSTTGGINKAQYVKRSHCESEQQEDQMAELEAELEAELDQLTGGDSGTMASQYSALDELDMDASVVYGDLAPTGLPGGVEEDTDEDLSPPARPAPLNNYAVSPRELTRLLRKLQTARQEELITELEEDLEAALSKLRIRDKELEVWKDRSRRLSEGSVVPASGEKSLTSSSPTEGVALVDRNSSIRADGPEASAAPRSEPGGGEETSYVSMLENGARASGIVSEGDAAGPGSHPRLEPALHGEVKSSLHTESAKQWVFKDGVVRGTYAIAAIMGLPFAEFLDEKTLASGAGSLLSSANGVNIIEETAGAIFKRSEGSSSSVTQKKPTMDLSAAKSEATAVAVPQDTTSLVDAKRMTDANGTQIDSVIIKTDDSSKVTRVNNPSTDMSPVPLISATLANFTSHDPAEADVLGEKPSTGLGDLGDATFITAVPVIQNLADVVEVMSVVTNDSEPQHQELQPPAPDATQMEGVPTMSADHFKAMSSKPLATSNDNVMAENNMASTYVIEGGAQMKLGNEKMEAGSDVKQEAAAIGSNVGESTDNVADNVGVPDNIESFLSGGEKEDENGENEPEGAEYEVDEAHQALPISERRKQKRLEVFVGGLDKETTEDDLTSVFKKVGDVVEVRLMKNPQTGKNKGYAFIRYATAALAKRAAQELERVEIRGRSCGVLPSEENDTLFLGNISKSWKKETVLDALKNFGIENVEDITLMEDPQLEGVNRGFAFIEFNTHKEALSAFRRLQQNDVVFGSDRSAKIAWAQPLNEPDEDTMSQVKSVFVDGMPPIWDEAKVKEHFSKFGAIERIVLARNMLSAKRKDFGFINFIDRDAALQCIEAVNNTEISDGDVKMKVKVMLAKPQTKSKPIKGGTRTSYPSGFRGDHRLGVGIGAGLGVGLGKLGLGMGMSMGMGMGLQGGMGLLPYDVLSGWGAIGGNIPRFDNQIRFGGVRDCGFGMTSIPRLEKKSKRSGKRNNEDLDAKGQLLQPMKEDNATNGGKKEKKTDGTKSGQEPFQSGDSNPINSCHLGNTEQPILQTSDVVSKPALDKFECTMCGFGSNSIDEYEIHKKTKVHKVIEGLRKDQKLNNKTPLSLLHEYASRHHCEVHYETEAETNGPFEVIAVMGGSAGGTMSAAPAKGFGVGRNKARAKQMAAANALEKILEKVSETELTKPGQSRQRFGERERPNRKGKGGNSGGGSGGMGFGGNRNSRGRSNEDWRSTQGGLNNPLQGLSNVSGGGRGGDGKNKRFNSNNMFVTNGCGSGYISNPNAIPLNGFNDFATAGGRINFTDRFAGRGGGGFSTSFQGPRGVTTHNLETYAERYDRIQGGQGYGNLGFGGRDFATSANRIGSNNFSSRDLAEVAFANRELPPPPPLLNFNACDIPPIGFASTNRDYEASGIKRPFVPMDDEARFVDVQRALPRQRLETPEQVSIHSNTNAQGFGVPQLFPEASRTTGPRPQEQPQFNTYVQVQPQGLPVGHNIVQSSHIPNQHANMPIAMVGVPPLPNTQGGTPYSIYDAAPQSNASLSANGYTNMNQDYIVSTPSIPEMSQANAYPAQTTYGAPYGIMPQTIPSQVVGNFAPMQNCVQQQTFY